MEWDPHGDRRRVFRTPDQKKLTVSLEHLILAIILVHLHILMYIKNISNPLCLLLKCLHPARRIISMAALNFCACG